MPRALRVVVTVVIAWFASGCATQDIPQAHRGRLFSRTGLLALYTGSNGLTGPVLDPGTHFLGVYNELRVIDCSTTTVRESLDTLTRDGVHFGFDLVTRFSADCSNEGVVQLLASLRPDNGDTVTAKRIYETFVQPAIGEAAREYVSPLRANELNEKQAEVADGVKRRFGEIMTTREKRLVKIYELNISHLQFPQALDTANLERAAQALLRDKAIAERERVAAEVETMAMRRKLSEQEAEVAVVKIEKVGSALAKNPAYTQFELVQRLPEIYREAGARGNLVLAAPNPLTLPNLGSGATPLPTPDSKPAPSRAPAR
ncbi:MAG TPA: SPFH domain-containing protein [Labilithrix sp.]|nr:SPFH domain-containing protein [Labilithrix sp.]